MCSSGHRQRDRVSDEGSGGDGVWPCWRVVDVCGRGGGGGGGPCSQTPACSKDLRDAGCWARARDALRRLDAA
jgi:hypothetical protein